MRFAPPRWAARTSSPRRAKSADRILGATWGIAVTSAGGVTGSGWLGRLPFPCYSPRRVRRGAARGSWHEGAVMAENPGDLVVETVRLTKIYQNRQIALNDVSLRLEPGTVLGLLGPNGAGKTTLLRLILGLHRPTAGWAKVFGQKMTPNAASLRRRIGYIPTNPQFPRGMTPITYLDYIARLFGLPLQARKPRLASLIRAVDLLNVSGDSIDGFSNGMSARLAVATSLINEPDLLIWDEPTQGLDPEGRRSILDLIKTLAREKTLIVCSHNLGDIDEVCNHAAVLSQGHLIYYGSLQDLKGRMRKNLYDVDV